MGKQLEAGITWLGHATYMVTTPADRSILLEGWVDSNPTCPEEWKGVDKVDAMLLTHGHADHTEDAVAIAKRSGAKVACIIELGDWLTAQGVDEQQVIAFNKGGTVEPVENVKVTMVHAVHSSSAPDGSYAGDPAGFIVELEDGYRIYHAGDTAVFGDMALIGELYRPDLALLPIGGFYTMDPTEAAHAVKLLGVSEVLAMHYGTFPFLTGRPRHLRQLVGPEVTVHELEPGETLGKIVTPA